MQITSLKSDAHRWPMPPLLLATLELSEATPPRLAGVRLRGCERPSLDGSRGPIGLAALRR